MRPDDGFSIHPGVFTRSQMNEVINALDRATIQRTKAGARHVLAVPEVHSIATDDALLAIACSYIGPGAFPFRATLFDKSLSANWLVAWHQDTALPIRERRDVAGWGPWTEKGGVLHAIAPATALEEVIALRVHIDDSTIDNGPLRVLPGTHMAGVLNDAEIGQRASEITAVDCLVGAGGVIAMKPLVLHASSKARSEHPRRVIHVEYAAIKNIGEGVELAITSPFVDSLSVFAGRWVANLARSRRHPGNLFQSASMDIEARGDTLTIVDRLVLESGDTHHGTNVMQVDGLEHATDGRGNGAIATQVSARVIDVVGIHAAGDGGRLRYEVSEDGRALTVSDDAGLMRVVFDRAER